jgi:hypothetical protein
MSVDFNLNKKPNLIRGINKRENNIRERNEICKQKDK